MKRTTAYTLLLAGSLATAASSHAQTVYTWNGGTGNWSNSSFWTTGVPNSASADVLIDGGKPVNSVVTMDGSYTVGRLTLDTGDTLNIANNIDFTVTNGAFAGSGAIINNGTINFNSQGNGIFLHANGPLSITGSGTINLNGGNDKVFANTAGDRITVGAGQTIAGTGNLGIGQTLFTNNGTVTANQNGNTLLLQPGGGGANDFTNGATGILRAENGGNLQLTGGSGGRFVGGTLQALAGSQVRLSEGANVSGATLATVGTGTVNVLNTATLTNVTNTGALVANNNSEVTLVGTLTNNGTFNLNSVGNGVFLRLSGPVTLAGTGTTTFTGGANQLFANTAGDRLTIAAGATLAGTANLGAGQTTFTNNGTVTANQNGGILVIQPGGGNGNNFLNVGAGVARAENGGILRLTGGSGGIFSAGTFQALTGSQVQLSEGANVSGATLATVGTGTVNVLNTATLTNVTNAGALVANNNSEVTLVGTLTNNGTFNLNSQGNGIFLRLSGATTLTGTGTTTLTGGNNQVFANAAGDRITVGAGQTIAGTGNLGIGQTLFTNNGTVTANQNGNTLLLQPGGGGANDFTSTATGIARAENGGNLQLTGGSGGTFGGLFQALNGSQVSLSDNANLIGATLATVGTGAVVVTNTATLTNVLNTGALVAVNNTTTTLVGTLTNNGTFNLNSQGNGDDLRLSGPVTLAGTGTTTFTGGANRLFAITAGDRLTIAAGATLAGTANLGAGQTTFTNNGTVTANQNGGILVIQPGGGNGNNFLNVGAGVARAENGGILQLTGGSGGTFGGLFQALNGSQVRLSEGANMVNATLATMGTGTTTVTNTATLTNVLNTGALVAVNNTTTTLVGTLTNNGTFNLNSQGNGDDLRLSGPVTLAGTGTTTFTGGANRLFAITAGDRLTIAAGATLAGTANLGAGQTTFTNNGTVTANQAGNTLTIQPGGGSGDFTNTATGIARAENGGTLQMSGSSGGLFTNNGIFAVNPGSTLSVAAGRLTNFAGTTLTGGKYLVTGSGAAGGAATMTFGGGTIATNVATVVLSGSNSTFAEINGLANNQGTFGITNGRNFTTAGALADSGSLVAGNNSVLTTLGNLTENSTGRLAGTGTFIAPTLTLSGTVAPGGQFDAAGTLVSSAGTLTLVGTTMLASSTSLEFELGVATFASSDHLVVNGSFTLDGTVNVTALAGFGAGRYDLVDYTGVFTNNVLNLGTVPAGYTYQIDTSVVGRVDLVVSAVVPEPGTWMWLAGGAALCAGYARRRLAGSRL